MTVKNNKLTDFSAMLEEKYGAPGTPERAQFDEEAYTFYTAQLLQQARKEARVTQSELARRTCTSKSYISRVEHGDIVPSVGKFWQMIASLGMRIEIVSPIG